MYVHKARWHIRLTIIIYVDTCCCWLSEWCGFPQWQRVSLCVCMALWHVVAFWLCCYLLHDVIICVTHTTHTHTLYHDRKFKHKLHYNTTFQFDFSRFCMSPCIYLEAWAFFLSLMDLRELVESVESCLARASASWTPYRTSDSGFIETLLFRRNDIRTWVVVVVVRRGGGCQMMGQVGPGSGWKHRSGWMQKSTENRTEKEKGWT